MLEDITKLTTKVFDEILDLSKNLKAPKNIYDLYRKFHKVIEKVSLVSEQII